MRLNNTFIAIRHHRVLQARKNRRFHSMAEVVLLVARGIEHLNLGRNFGESISIAPILPVTSIYKKLLNMVMLMLDDDLEPAEQPDKRRFYFNSRI